MLRILFVFFSTLLVLPTLQAHHGRKYLVTSSHQIAEPGSFYGLLTTNLQSRLGERVNGLQPGILLGLRDRWDVEFHTHHVFEDGHFHTEAIGIESRFGLFGSFADEDSEEQENIAPFGVAFLGEFEKGLHYHEDIFEGRLIIGGSISSLPVAANLIWQQSFGDEPSNQLRCAVGIRKNMVHSIDIGVEFQGNFKGFTDTKLTPGVYISATEKFDLKLGATLGLNSPSNEQTIHVALVYGL